MIQPDDILRDGSVAAAAPSEKRSHLLSAFFDRLNAIGARYCLMNNYEKLPWVIPSDVDVAIEPRYFSVLDDLVSDFAREEDSIIVQKLWHGNKKCAYILAVGEVGSREFLQLDFFVDFSTRYCPMLIEYHDLVCGRRELRNFYAPRPAVEIVFIAMRRLFKNDWSERHCERISELRAQITAPDWLPARYSWIGEAIDLASERNVAELERRRPTDWQNMKRVARRALGRGAHIRNLYWQARRILYRLRHETGNLTTLRGELRLSDTIGNGLPDSLEQVFHRNLIVSEDWLQQRRWVKKIFFPIGLLIQLKLLKLRKGLIVLKLGEDAPRSRRLAVLLDRFGLIDQVVVHDVEAPEALKFAGGVAWVSNSDDLIEAILKSQATKTSAAMQWRWSQTSGPHLG